MYFIHIYIFFLEATGGDNKIDGVEIVVNGEFCFPDKWPSYFIK